LRRGALLIRGPATVAIWVPACMGQFLSRVSFFFFHLLSLHLRWGGGRQAAVRPPWARRRRLVDHWTRTRGGACCHAVDRVGYLYAVGRCDPCHDAV